MIDWPEDHLNPPERPPICCPICGDECGILYENLVTHEIVGCENCINSDNAELLWREE